MLERFCENHGIEVDAYQAYLDHSPTDADVSAFCTRHGVNADEFKKYLMRGKPGARRHLRHAGVTEDAINSLLMADPVEVTREPAPVAPADVPEPRATEPEPPQAAQESQEPQKPAASPWDGAIAKVNAERPHTWST